jgi:kanamycin kinase
MNLDSNYGPDWEAEFFMAYGIAPDAERMAFYRFLWENEDTLGVPPGSSR